MTKARHFHRSGRLWPVRQRRKPDAQQQQQQHHQHPQHHLLPGCSANSNGAATAAVSITHRRRGSEFVVFPYEKACRPRLTPFRRRLRLVSFACIAVSFAFTYSIFVVRCVQNGGILSAGVDATMDQFCLAGLCAAGCLLTVCLLVQLLDTRSQPDSCCRRCCCCCSDGADGDSEQDVSGVSEGITSDEEAAMQA